MIVLMNEVLLPITLLIRRLRMDSSALKQSSAKSRIHLAVVVRPLGADFHLPMCYCVDGMGQHRLGGGSEEVESGLRKAVDSPGFVPIEIRWVRALLKTRVVELKSALRLAGHSLLIYKSLDEERI
jgi:hypothetical protein